MGFYIDWNAKLQAGESTSLYISDFIKSKINSLKSFDSDNDNEFDSAFIVLRDTSISLFIEEIKKLNDLPQLISEDVPCFSKMENGSSRINELLLFYPDGLTFSEIGYQLMHSVNDIAQKKYGENQSKLAEMMSLVELSHTRPIVVKSTAWGKYLTRYTFEEKKEVLKKLLLRNICIQTLIRKALKGKVCYNEVVSFLSHSTKIRRRTNVRYLVNFILSDSEYGNLLSNINWMVN